MNEDARRLDEAVTWIKSYQGMLDDAAKELFRMRLPWVPDGAQLGIWNLAKGAIVAQLPQPEAPTYLLKSPVTQY